MIISKSKKFIYIHLDKCGGTSIEQSLSPFLSKEDIQIGSLNYNEDNLNNFILSKHSTAKDISQYLKEEWNNFYKFTTVRNPKDIMISLYFYTKNNFEETSDDPYFINYKNCILEKTGIDGFIKKMIEQKHFSVLPLTSRIDNTVNLFDIDNILKDWHFILNKINIQENIKLNVLNKSNKPNNVLLKKETLELIYEHFKNDYDEIPKITGHKWEII